ncbi:site-specific integrase [Prescottella equi]|uniref:site-specific integrase n=1 Tax=Rhodococcus hoagii TaxID=43767 RepID=UPI0023DCAF5E|nr:site-specific integrase [Prescottella equi]
MPRPSLPIGAHGRISRTKLPDGRWRAACRYRDADGVTRQVVRYTPPTVDRDKTGAAAERALVDALKERSTTGDLSADSRVSELWVAYRAQLEEKNRSQSTLQDYDRMAAKILDGLGNLRIREATTQRLDTFVREIATRQGAGTGKKAKTILSGMFRIAVRYGAVQANPVREVTDLGAGRKKRAKSMDRELLVQLLADVRGSETPCPVVLSEAQIKRGVKTTSKAGQVPSVAQFCQSADLADLIVMFAATGARIGEVLGIRWEDVDLKKRTVAITGKVIRVKGDGLVREDSTKTESGLRQLPLPGFAVEMLEKRLVDRSGPMVFPSKVGTLRDPDTVQRQWRQVRAALDLEWVTTHTFRKTVATILDDEGLTARQAADHLGHAQVSMTQDVYLGRGRTHSAAAAALDAAVAKR